MSTSPENELTPPRATPGALDRRPLLRMVAAVLWSAFFGAAIGICAMLLLPMMFWEPPMDEARLAWLFCIMFIVALVPAYSAAVLMRPTEGSSSER